MLYLLLRLYFFNIDQETVLNWFGIKDRGQSSFSPIVENDYSVTLSFEIEPSMFL
jgi:hypothetical protein